MDNLSVRHRKRGTALTLMLCGRSGLGKSTFLNTLCGCEVEAEPATTLELSKREISLADYSGRPLHVTAIDTPGFGQSINNSSHVNQLVQYVEQQFDELLSQETRVDRGTFMKDSRIHCCLYFLPGRVSPLDVEAIGALSRVVNVIPVLAKSDTMTCEERATATASVQNALSAFPLYQFGFNLNEEDSEFIDECMALRLMVPFGVSGSNAFHSHNGELTRGRLHVWGLARCEDPDLGDVSVLRNVLFGEQLDELKQSTLELYEAYRTRILTKRAAGPIVTSSASLLDTASKISV